MYVILVTINKSLRCTVTIDSCVLIICDRSLTHIHFMVTLHLDTKFLLSGERYYFTFDGKIMKTKDLWCCQCHFGILRPTLWSIDILFQWIVLIFDSAIREISPISSSLVTFCYILYGLR